MIAISELSVADKFTKKNKSNSFIFNSNKARDSSRLYLPMPLPPRGEPDESVGFYNVWRGSLCGKMGRESDCMVNPNPEQGGDDGTAVVATFPLPGWRRSPREERPKKLYDESGWAPLPGQRANKGARRRGEPPPHQSIAVLAGIVGVVAAIIARATAEPLVH
mgnify:CR=1 FL=1